MRVLDDDYQAVYSFHKNKQENASFPCLLVEDIPSSQRDNWCCVATSPSEKFCFLNDKNLPLADLQFPLIKYPVLLGCYAARRINNISDVLRTRGDKILCLVESYNKLVLEMIKSFDYVETYFCQKKMICSLQNLSKNIFPLPNNINIRHFVVGEDESNYVITYNRILGFLGSIINDNFISQIVSRPSFDPEGYFFAEYAGEIIGFLNIEIEPWGGMGSGFAYIYQIGIDDLWKGKGLAASLLHAASMFAISRGSNRIGVGIRKSNQAAVNFFSNMGFKEAYRVTGYLLDVQSV